MALANSTRVLIADEPTAGLDVTISRQILDLMRDLIRDFDSSLILVSRDLGVVAHYCERVAVMYKGRVLEVADVPSFFKNPAHPYSRHLILASQASRDSALSEKLLTGKTSGATTNGCSYYSRCPVSIDRCQTETPPEERLSETHSAVCFRSKDVALGELL
jgi:oligopeptide/dipeptide ABC transporter ATP-binding protein